MSKLRNFIVGAGLATVGAIAAKKGIDYFRNRGQDEIRDESEGDIAIEETAEDEVAYVTVEPSSVQEFLDKSFGTPGRYVPTRPPKVFEYKGGQYMVIWARDNEKNKNQMLAFKYTDAGREMIASVGYTPEVTDYNLEKLADTPFAVEINGEKFTSGKGQTAGTTEVDFVPKDL